MEESWMVTGGSRWMMVWAWMQRDQVAMRDVDSMKKEGEGVIQKAVALFPFPSVVC